MSGKSSRNKGMRVEREMVRIFQEHGYAAEKVSRMYGPDEDISVPVLGIDRIVEVKARKDGFREDHKWLAGKFAVIKKANNQEPLITMRLRDAVFIGTLAEKMRT